MPRSQQDDPAIAAMGTLIEIESSPNAYTPINGVGDITGPNTSVAEVETTSHSTSTPHRTFKPTLIDDGDCSFPCYFNPSDPTHSLYSPYGLEYVFQNRQVRNWRIVNTDPGKRTRQFKGFVKNLGESYPVAGICTRNVAIRLTSVPTDVMPTVTFTPPTGTATAAGGSGTVAVAATGEGSWFPTSASPWITITGPTEPQTGNGNVDYTTEANSTGAARTGQIMVAGKTYNVDQAAS